MKVSFKINQILHMLAFYLMRKSKLSQILSLLPHRIYSPSLMQVEMSFFFFFN